MYPNRSHIAIALQLFIPVTVLAVLLPVFFLSYYKWEENKLVLISSTNNLRLLYNQEDLQKPFYIF
jgi:hypothetical protein